MKSVLLIGLGLFGQHAAQKLAEDDHEIMAVDIIEERVNSVLPYVTSAQIGDTTNVGFLESLGVDNFDVCIVTIGDNFQASLETTNLLKEFGAKKVVSRASSDIHEKFLLKNGADEDTPRSTFLISSRLTAIIRFLSLQFPNRGMKKQLLSLTFARNTTSTS